MDRCDLSRCERRTEKFMLFCDLDGSFLRRQLEAMTIGHGPLSQCAIQSIKSINQYMFNTGVNTAGGSGPGPCAEYEWHDAVGSPPDCRN